MKILVAIASYGSRNDRYLAELIHNYRSMPYEVHIVVLSNIAKRVGEGIEVRVGLPTKDPWSLPFAHKKLFAERVNDYDLFIYSEDDTPLSQNNIEAFLRVTSFLPEDEIAGFLRSESGPDGKQYFCDVLGPYHWDVHSVRKRKNHVFAFFTNEHAACFILTQRQLRKAIASGGFLVEPHQETYDLLCTAATDPYTQCSFKKMICISHLSDFTVPHLPNKYVGVFGVEAQDLRRQIEVLLSLNGDNGTPEQLFETRTQLPRARYSKVYYEAAREDVARLIPIHAKSVLSLGCGEGKMEAWLAKKGYRVTAIPLDRVIAAGVETKGVELVGGSFEAAQRALEGRKFDCVLFANLLHLVPEPSRILGAFTELLSKGGVAIALVPNVSWLALARQKNRGNLAVLDATRYEKTGVHLTSPKIIRSWFEESGLKVERIVNTLSLHRRKAGRLSLGLANSLLAIEYVVVAHREKIKSGHPMESTLRASKFQSGVEGGQGEI